MPWQVECVWLFVGTFCGVQQPPRPQNDGSPHVIPPRQRPVPLAFSIVGNALGGIGQRLVDAIKLLLGARADPGDVRLGEREALVEAVFDLSGGRATY